MVKLDPWQSRGSLPDGAQKLLPATLRGLVTLVTSSDLLPVDSVGIVFDTGFATEIYDLLDLSDAELASGVEVEANRAKATDRGR